MSPRPSGALPAIALVICAGVALAAEATEPQAVQAAATPAAATAAHRSAAAASVETQDPRLAGALIQAAAVRTPDNLVAVAYRYQQLRILDKALDYYSEAVAIDPKNAPAYDGRARIWRDWGRLSEALGDATRATFIAPADAVAWNTMGTVLQRLNRKREARDAFTRSIALAPGAPHAWNNLCYMSILDARVEDAILECSSALAVSPEFAAGANNLALAYATAGKLDRAFDLYKQAGGEGHAHFKLGQIRMTQKDYDAAILSFEAALRADPKLAAARRLAREARRLARTQG
jgi:tetratricopeptide (TPR) repeat protein